MSESGVVLADMTKEALVAFAAEHHGLTLPSGMNKVEMIKAIVDAAEKAQPVSVASTDSSPTSVTSSVPEEVYEEEVYGPWVIDEVEGSEQFAPFGGDGNPDGLSLVAWVVDPQGHTTEYSASFVRGLDIEDVLVMENEDDQHLMQRLRDAVVAEVNDPVRADLIRHRFE